jgi:hypothetical protein
VSRDTSSRLTALSYAVGVPVVLVLGLVFAIRDGAWLFAAILGLTGLGWGLFYLWTWKVMRDVENLSGDIPDEPGEPTEVMLAVDAFEDAIRDAYDVPLTDQVRLDRRKADRLLEQLRTALPRGSSTLSTLFSELDELVRNAKTIPLTEQIRLDRDDVYDILDRMRASFAAGG